MPVARAGVPASDKQIDFAAALAAQVHGDNAAEFILAHREYGTFDDRKATSELIDALVRARNAMKAPRDRGPAMPEPSRYAVEYGGVLRFYAVVDGKGRWEGRRFLNRFRSEELGRVGRDEQAAVVALIAADPAAAQMRFARELTRCFMCGRMLTDEASRARGIGPDCAGLR